MKNSLVIFTLAVALAALSTHALGQQYGAIRPGMYPQPGFQPAPYGYPAMPVGYQMPVAPPPQASYAPGTAPGGCADGTCEMPCDPRWEFFGEFLYLRARDADVPYAVPINGPISAPPSYAVQSGRVANVDPDYQPGFRVGLARSLDVGSSLRGMYTFYESDTEDRITLPGEQDRVLRSLVTHPGTWTVASDGLDAHAFYDIDFQTVDVDFRSIFACGPQWELAYFGGVKYVHLEEDFAAQFAVLGTERVDTEIQFDGGGIRVGLEGERRARNMGFLVYGRTSANFVAGEFHADYLQQNGEAGLLVDTGWSAGRVISILDLELGIGWAGPGNRVRVTGGYLISGWFNTVQTDEWIQAVQNNDFTDLDDTLTFDGFTGRIEFRY